MVTTTESTSPSPLERSGVALSRVVTDRPSGSLRTISSTRTVSLALSACARGNSAREDLAPVGASDGQDFKELFHGAVRQHQALDDSHRLPVDRRQGAGPRVEDRHAHRRGVDQGLQVGPGPLLVPVAAGVGDHQRRLGGEHQQGLLVFSGELLGRLLLGEIEVARTCAPPWRIGVPRKEVTATGGLNSGMPRDLMWLGRSRILTGSGIRLRYSNSRSPSCMVHSSPVLLGSHAGGEQRFHQTRIVEGGDHAVPGAGQRACAVHDLLEHVVEVQTLVDAQGGLGEPGQAVSRGIRLPGAGRRLDSFHHLGLVPVGGHGTHSAVGPEGRMVRGRLQPNCTFYAGKLLPNCYRNPLDCHSNDTTLQ